MFGIIRTVRIALEGTQGARKTVADALRVMPSYMPSNYTFIIAPDGKTAIIAGEDNAGWTLDGYVLPRLAQAGFGKVWDDE